MTRYILLITLMLSFAAQLFSQEPLTTKSGQQIILTPDGNYVTSNTNTVIDQEIDQIRLKNENGAMTDEVRSVLNQVMHSLKAKEVSAFMKEYQWNAELEMLDEKKKQAKERQLAEAELDKMDEQMDKTKLLKSIAQKEAKDAFKYMKKVKDLYKSKDTKLNHKANELVSECNERFGSNLAGVHIAKVVSYDFKVDKRDPNRMYHEAECDITYNAKDPDLKKHKIEHGPQHLFSYTNPKAKHFFKNENFLNCDAYLTKLGSKYFLNMDIKLATKDATRSYGVISKDDMIKITFVNRENIIAKSLYEARGQLEAYSGRSVYKAVFPLNKDQVKLIKNQDLDFITIIWSTGSESYEIYDLELLAKQYKCIEQAR